MDEASGPVPELRERLRLLQEENEALAERAEDAMLLGLIGEKINHTEIQGDILAIGLEQTALLKELPLATYWEFRGDEAFCVACYCACGPEPTGWKPWVVPAVLRERLRAGPWVLSHFDQEDFGLVAALQPLGCRLAAVGLFPVRFATGGSGVFVFGEDRPGSSLKLLQPLLARSTEMIAIRCDSVRLMQDLRALNAALDRRVEQRTWALKHANTLLEQQIRERESAEDALALSVQRFRQAFSDGPLGMVLTDLQGRFVEVNRAFCEFLGYTPDELRELTIADVTAPEDLSRNVEMFQAALGSPEGAYSLEKRYRHKGGGLVWGRVAATILRNAAGEPILRMGMVEDTTAQKAAERASQESEEKCRAAEQERQQLQEQLAQAHKMESVGRLAGGVAHDFNNLLTAILGNVEVALAEIDPASQSTLEEPLREIHAAGKRAADLTRQLLAFSRKQVLRMQTLDLNEAITGFGRMLKRLISENVEIAFVLAPDLGRVRADPTQIEQVLLNLALNARDAMPDGGQLTIATSRTELPPQADLRLPEVAPGPYALISVCDTGCGMDQETIDRIFEPFFTTKVAGQGTGLGLATVYGIVRQHGGQVLCESQPGQGSAFRVYLPLVDAEEAAPVSDSGEQPVSGGSETILLVEDDASVRVLSARILRRLGYEVVEAADGATAVTWASQQPRLNLLLTDVVMPHMGGRQVAEQVKALHPAVRVVFVSGYSDEVMARQGALEPGTGFLQKPFTSQTLGRVVRQALGGCPPV